MDSTRRTGAGPMTSPDSRVSNLAEGKQIVRGRLSPGRSTSGRFVRAVAASAFLLTGFLISIQSARAQGGPYERTFRQPKNAVEKTLKELQAALSGRLPAVEGFALPGDHPLNRYQRAYYTSEVQVSSNASGGSVVRVTTKV